MRSKYLWRMPASTAISGSLAIGLLFIATPLVPAQASAPPAVVASQVSNSEIGPLVYDVVSVKPTKRATDRETIESPPDSDGIIVGNMTLEEIIEFAYSIPLPEMVSGLPEWAKTKKFDLAAKVADTDVARFRILNQTQRGRMLQAVLASRFQLKTHHDEKAVPIYALVVAKNGPKMRKAKPGDGYANGSRFADGSSAGAATLIPTPMGITGQGVQMAALAVMLSRLDLGRQVVDKTGLTGRYDFTLRCAPTYAMRPVINGEMAPLSPEDEALPSIFTAVQEQLGLKLEPTTGLVASLVIDHVELPSEN